jgi:hypothetical protein
VDEDEEEEEDDTAGRDADEATEADMVELDITEGADDEATLMALLPLGVHGVSAEWVISVVRYMSLSSGEAEEVAEEEAEEDGETKR